MKKKNRLRGIAAGIFCLGVLLGGIGTGIAFTEFSSFAYQEVSTPEDAFKTVTFTYYIEEEDGEIIWLRSYCYGATCKLEEREDIPVGSVKIEAVYNSELCRMESRKEQNGEGETWIHLRMLSTLSDIGQLMRNKDGFLEGLKNRELRDYQEKYVESVEYQINPADRKRFRLN